MSVRINCIRNAACKSESTVHRAEILILCTSMIFKFNNKQNQSLSKINFLKKYNNVP
jgi:hypothetical protein